MKNRLLIIVTISQWLLLAIFTQDNKRNARWLQHKLPAPGQMWRRVGKTI